MMSKSMFLVGAAVCLASTLWAQSKDTTGADTLDEIIVTANRLPQKQSQTGKVVSVISRAQLEKSAGRTLGQLLNEQAGITIAGALNNAGSPQTLFMRGANAGRTLILVDGIPAYDPSLINNEFDLNLVNLNDVERVEICRGAQSTLYGSDAVAGVINIITAKSEVTKAVNVKATANYGSFNTFRGNLQVYGKADKLSYTARYARTQTEGFSAAHDSTGKQGFDNDHYRGNAMSAALQYQFSKAWSIRGFAQRNDYQSEVDASAFADEKDFTIDNKGLMAGGGFQYQAPNVKVTGNYMFSDITRGYRNDSLDKPGFTLFSTDDYYGRNQFLELYTNLTLGKGFSAVYGMDYRYSSMNNQYYSLSAFGPFTSGFNDTSVSQGSFYGSMLYQGGRWNLELGGRMNVHTRYGSNSTYTFNPSFQWTPHVRLFASIASGFKAPSLYQLYSYAGNPGLEAEESTNYEGGVQLTTKPWQTRVVFFHRNIDNGIDYDYNRFQYFNIVAQKVSGIEWEGAATLAKGLRLTTNYTLLIADENAQSRITANDSTYRYLLRRPRHQLNATLGYALGTRGYASLQAKWVSERYDAGGYKAADVLLEGYLLMGAYAEYRINPRLRLFAEVQNLFNTRFFDVRGYNGIPLMASGGVTMQL